MKTLIFLVSLSFFFAFSSAVDTDNVDLKYVEIDFFRHLFDGVFDSVLENKNLDKENLDGVLDETPVQSLDNVFRRGQLNHGPVRPTNLEVDSKDARAALKAALEINPFLTEIKVLKAEYKYLPYLGQIRVVLKAALGVCRQHFVGHIGIETSAFKSSCSLEEVDDVQLFEIEALVGYLVPGYTATPALRKITALSGEVRLQMELKQQPEHGPYKFPDCYPGAEC